MEGHVVELEITLNPKEESECILNILMISTGEQFYLNM